MDAKMVKVKIKALRHDLDSFVETLEELVEYDFGDYVEYLEMEGELNDALGHKGGVCWHDMIKEVALLKKASL